MRLSECVRPCAPLEDGYASMHAYCLGVLLMSEDKARKRIHAARVAHRFPVLFEAVADGSMNLTAINVLAPHLGEGNAEELIAAAKHHSKSEIEHLLASWFPQIDVPTQVAPVSAPSSVETLLEQRAPERVAFSLTEPVPPARVAPIAPERYALQCTLRKATHDLLRQAQDLLSHELPTGDVDEVLHRALTGFVARLAHRKCGATAKPRRESPSTKPGSRYIPAAVRCAVWQRDGGQCTFVSESGHRCGSRRKLEFDHAQEFARGGEATVANLRLRCRAHHQFAAEQSFGAGFMAEKRAPQAQARVTSRPDLDVTPWLRQLGFRAAEAREAALHCDTLAECSLEERVKRALAYLRPRRGVQHPAAATG